MAYVETGRTVATVAARGRIAHAGRLLPFSACEIAVHGPTAFLIVVTPDAHRIVAARLERAVLRRLCWQFVWSQPLRLLLLAALALLFAAVVRDS